MSTDRSNPALAYTLPFQLTKKIHRAVPTELNPENSENSAKGKIIVITGGGTGIGAAAARVWVRAGAEGVVIAGRREDVLEKTAKELKALSKGATKILAVRTDITKEKDTDNLFAQVKESFGRPAEVVLANAAALSTLQRPHEETVENWWKIYEINMLGTHNTAMSFIRSQPNPSEPVGSLISVNSGLAGMLEPLVSAYSTSKLAVQRYMEYLNLEYPTLRVFSLMPGIVATEMAATSFLPYAKDDAEQTGALALYLSSPRADYLKGSMTSINWDIDEMEAHKGEIEKGLLKIKWHPILPVSGGSGF
ncbi:short chain dehydrogenase-like protein [Lindgomyces ingoldianus]|uniref:Short chain dehydrogenase-like protein n=1 Tax=Lindgomyces ingoldianus TaxID=673940 RepID=A0ACB6QCY8_9PLEO|nr:short chain dehydrogenase-like protein [Lindgomyces ingoldianus]KAF2464762.1 short chain dehydrogenase-like protein [Lindgomyces ingoldianus]